MKIKKGSFNFHNDVTRRSSFQLVAETREEALIIDQLVQLLGQNGGQLRLLGMDPVPTDLHTRISKVAKRPKTPVLWAPWHGYPN